MHLSDKNKLNFVIRALSKNSDFSLEKITRRLISLEKKINRLSTSHRSLYHLAYARLKRRSDTDLKALSNSKRWYNNLSKNKEGLNRLSMMLSKLDAGRNLVYLYSRQAAQLRILVKRKIPYKRKKQHEKAHIENGNPQTVGRSQFTVGRS